MKNLPMFVFSDTVRSRIYSAAALFPGHALLWEGSVF